MVSDPGAWANQTCTLPAGTVHVQLNWWMASPSDTDTGGGTGGGWAYGEYKLVDNGGGAFTNYIVPGAPDTWYNGYYNFTVGTGATEITVSLGQYNPYPVGNPGEAYNHIYFDNVMPEKT